MQLLIAAAMMLTATAASADDLPRLRAPDVLRCFHPTARYLSREKISTEWAGASDYGAERSEVDQIHFSGAVTYHPYTLDAAVIWRKGMVRVVLLADTAAVPPNDKCALLNWQG